MYFSSRYIGYRNKDMLLAFIRLAAIITKNDSSKYIDKILRPEIYGGSFHRVMKQVI